MADVTTSSSDLKVEAYFVDGDTRTITIKNPRADLTEENIKDLQTFMQTNQPVLGDKLQAAFGKITKATIVKTESTYLDIDN